MVERILITDRGEPASTVLIGAGIVEESKPEVLLPRPDRTRRVAIITHAGADPTAHRIAGCLRRAGFTTATRVLPDREEAKSLTVAEEAYLWLNDLGMTRDDTILGIGGGALTDAAGFIAATYLRGIELVLVPTTLLGAVDASIGGKTAINVGGKNLAGVFRHPERVLIDSAVLAALPDELLIEGSAEAVKAGLIADPALVELYEREGRNAPLGEVVIRAVRVKAQVVSEDFRESGPRAVLNYGHTIGHAIETATGIPHGHAVAIGMVAAANASERLLGFSDAERQRTLLERLGLPTSSPPVDRDVVMGLMALDKKRNAAGLRMVLLERIGSATVSAVDTATVEAALGAVGIT